MKNQLIILSTCAMAFTGCFTESKFGEFDRAEVLSFTVEDEMITSLVLPTERKIEVTMDTPSALEAAVLSGIRVSTLAQAEIEPGDVMGLNRDFSFDVVAEDGTTVEWTVVATARNLGEGGVGGAGGASNDSEDDVPADEGEDQCGTTLATYSVDGTFVLTDTPLGLGDGSFPIGPGTITLRFTHRGNNTADIAVIEYEMSQSFEVNAPGAATKNTSMVTAGPDECGLAQGYLSNSRVAWERCDYGATPPHGTTNWGATDVVGGPGCLNDYTVEGEVTCEGAFCGISGVDFPLDLASKYPQPLTAFEFTEDLSSFKMRGMGAPEINANRSGVEVPNKEPSRSWLSLDGTLIKEECAPVPVCD